LPMGLTRVQGRAPPHTNMAFAWSSPLGPGRTEQGRQNWICPLRPQLLPARLANCGNIILRFAKLRSVAGPKGYRIEFEIRSNRVKHASSKNSVGNAYQSNLARRESAENIHVTVTIDRLKRSLNQDDARLLRSSRIVADPSPIPARA
jgi:hypothetical protein